MKKFIAIFSVFLFLSFSMNTTTTLAQPKTFTQGFYTMKNLNLYENNPYFVQNLSTYGTGMLIIIDTNSVIQQVIRVIPNSPKYALIPLLSDYNFIIYGNIDLVFS